MAEIRRDTSNVSTSSTNVSMHKLKLPTFDDNQDDMDSCLRFECITELQEWSNHVYLGSSLRGHALKVYFFACRYC